LSAESWALAKVFCAFFFDRCNVLGSSLVFTFPDFAILGMLAS
jgi:hypothetical protein